MIIGWLKRRKEREQEEKDRERKAREYDQRKYEEESKAVRDFAKPGDRIKCAGITFVVKRVTGGSPQGWLLHRYGIVPKIYTVFQKNGELCTHEFTDSDLDMLKAENKR